MASLRSLLGSKNFTQDEVNLEKGRIWAYTNGSMYGFLCNGMCWVSPGSGTAQIEMWGAGGSGSRMCFCGGGLPGNAAAFTKKTVSVSSGDRVCGCVGKSCGNTDLCFRGCGAASGICYVASSGNGCMCAQGGRGGISMCSTSPSLYCCYLAQGHCATNRGPNCGLVCNQCSGAWLACGYGGDTNRCGCISCASFLGCYPQCTCMHYYHAALPANVIGKDGAMITYATEDDNPYSRWSGMGQHQYINALNAASRSPSQGVYHGACWMGNRACQCYEMLGCQHHVPYGAGGPASNPCPGVRDHGWRGGHGAVRIKYTE